VSISNCSLSLYIGIKSGSLQECKIDNKGNVYNTLAGNPQSVSPLPYKDQLLPPT
jgi:hypothetical protein